MPSLSSTTHSKMIVKLHHLLLLLACASPAWGVPPGLLFSCSVLNGAAVADRTPYYFISSDTANAMNTWNPPRAMALTVNGSISLYNQGRILSNNVVGFLSSSFDPSEVYVRAADIDVVLQSASSLLAGLYLPQSGVATDVRWLPSPVHTTAASVDLLLQPPSRNCPAFVNDRYNYKESDAFTALQNKYASLYSTLQQITGSKDPFDTLILDVADTLQVEIAAGRTILPALADLQATILNAKTDLLNGFYASPTAKKLSAGFLLSQITRLLQAKADSLNPWPLGNNIGTKMVMYWTQEENIFALNSLLMVLFPPASGQPSPNGEPAFNLLQSSSEPTVQITSGAFTTSTTLSQFVSAVSGYLAQDSDCVLTGNGDDDDDDFFYATTPERIATIVILIALIGCVGVAVWYHQRKRKQEQQQMQSHAADVLLHDMEPDSASEENRFTLQ